MWKVMGVTLKRRDKLKSLLLSYFSLLPFVLPSPSPYTSYISLHLALI
jgi:hypothetical protein